MYLRFPESLKEHVNLVHKDFKSEDWCQSGRFGSPGPLPCHLQPHSPQLLLGHGLQCGHDPLCGWLLLPLYPYAGPPMAFRLGPSPPPPPPPLPYSYSVGYLCSEVISSPARCSPPDPLPRSISRADEPFASAQPDPSLQYLGISPHPPYCSAIIGYLLSPSHHPVRPISQIWP